MPSEQHRTTQAKKALDALQGTWKIESVQVGGKQLPAELIAKKTLTIKGDQFIPTEQPEDVATVKLDPSKKPAEIDITERSKKVSLGIYEQNGDTLKLCFGEARPKTFESPEGSKSVYMVLKRDTK